MPDLNLQTFEISLAELRGLPGEAAGVAWANPVDLAHIRDEYVFLGDGAQISLDGDILRVSIPESDDHHRTKAKKDSTKAADAARRGEYGRAITLFSKALSVDPGQYDIRRDLAMAHFEKGDHQKARQLLRQILLLAPRDHWAHVILANSYMKQDRDIARAERHFLLALRSAPNDAWALNGLGVLFLEKGAALDALDCFSRAIDAAPSFANAHLGRSRALEMLSRHDEAIASLERLFVEADRQDARALPVIGEARVAYLRIETILATERQDDALSAAMDLKQALEREGGASIRIEEVPLPAKIVGMIQMGWKHGRDYHLLRLRSPDKSSATPGYRRAHIITHELGHLHLEQSARACGRNKFFATDKHTTDRVYLALRGDVERLRRHGLNDGEIAKSLDSLIKGACGLLFNTPIDMLIEQRIRRDHPRLRHAQFCTQHALAFEARESTMNPDARRLSPRRILAANDALNGAYALFLDDLFEGATSYFAPYSRLEAAKTAHALYGKWRNFVASLRPGDEYNLVDDFAALVDMTGWYRWLEDAGTWTASEIASDIGGGTTNPSLLREKSAAAVAYLTGALERFRAMTAEQVREVAFEIAVLGRSGLDYSSNDKKYSLNSIHGEQFSGLHLMCLMFAGFKQIDPSLDTGIDLADEYCQALRLSGGS